MSGDSNMDGADIKTFLKVGSWIVGAGLAIMTGVFVFWINTNLSEAKKRRDAAEARMVGAESEIKEMQLAAKIDARIDLKLTKLSDKFLDINAQLAAIPGITNWIKDRQSGLGDAWTLRTMEFLLSDLRAGGMVEVKTAEQYKRQERLEIIEALGKQNQ